MFIFQIDCNLTPVPILVSDVISTSAASAYSKLENYSTFNGTTESSTEIGLDIGPIVEYVPVSTTMRKGNERISISNKIK